MEESSVGFFGQFKYVFKGIVKPGFFSKLANQSKFCVGAYTVIMALVSVIVYFGISFLFVSGDTGVLGKIKKVVDAAPEFTYADGRIDFDEVSMVEIDGVYYIFDSTVNSSTKEYMNKIEIKIDWQHGVRACVFNGRAFTYVGGIRLINAIRPKFIYKQAFGTFGFLNIPASFDKNGFKNVLASKFIFAYLFFAGISLIPFTIKAIITGVIFMFLGFGIAKIVKLPWTKPELFRLAIYITGVTTIVKSALTALPFIPAFSVLYWIISGIMVLGVGAYLFFAITGSTEEAGPSSTIVFNKPGAKKLDDIAPPDPFEKKNYRQAEYASRAAAPASTYSAPVAAATAATTAAASSATVEAPQTTASESRTQFSAKAESSEPAPARRFTGTTTSTASTGSTLFHAQSETQSSNTQSAADKQYSTFGGSRYTKPEATAASSLFHSKSESTETNTLSGYNAFGKASKEEASQPSIFETIDLNSENSYSETQQPGGYSDFLNTGSAQETAAESVTYTEAPVQEYVESTPVYEEPAQVYTEAAPVYEEPAPVYEEPAPEPASAVVKSDIGTYGGMGSVGGKKKKDKWARPITAPDAYNGLYYSGSDEEESYESNYGSGTLLDRGGLYGKTIGGPETSNPFASVLGGAQPSPVSSGIAGSSSYFGKTLEAPVSNGSSLYSSHTEHNTGEHLTFTTKGGSQPFDNGGFFLSNPPRNGGSSSSHTTVTKGGKTVNRYSDDDFAAWEREHYADTKPRGGFGNNIF